MVNARNSKMFKSEKLRAFSVDYLTKRSDLNYSLALVDIEKLPKVISFIFIIILVHLKNKLLGCSAFNVILVGMVVYGQVCRCSK